jgi:hypothetical protein
MDILPIVALLRDIVIIIVGLIWIVAGLLVAAVAWLSWRFARSVPRRAEAVTVPAHELLGQARTVVGAAGEGARTAKETIGFVSEKVVVPTISIASAAVGVRKFVETLVAGPRTSGREDMG